MVATLSDKGWPDGFRVPVPGDAPGSWRAVFNSDALECGGDTAEDESELPPAEGHLSVKLPPRSCVVLRPRPAQLSARARLGAATRSRGAGRERCAGGKPPAH